jgi:TetR/AcrR family transcriptional repressor of nem operon
MDLSRQTGDARVAFDAGVAALLARLRGWLPEDAADADALAVSVMTELVGAVVLARAVIGRKLSDEILRGARRSVRARAGLPEAAAGGPK